MSFRRCSGFVEQFDVQSPQLTVRETVLFSARLRLDSTVAAGDIDIQHFVDKVLNDVELSAIAGVLVGTDETGGLSFEQKKRLSIAVELAASPSILFLDEVRFSYPMLALFLLPHTLTLFCGFSLRGKIPDPCSCFSGESDLSYCCT